MFWFTIPISFQVYYSSITYILLFAWIMDLKKILMIQISKFLQINKNFKPITINFARSISIISTFYRYRKSQI